jgi:hypothetical protein
VKPAAPPIRTSRLQKAAEPSVLGRSASKDPALDQARRVARDKDLKPTRSSASSAHDPDNTEDLNSKRKPSRASRSMKSRQSEPRASRSGPKAKTGTRQTVKPPVALMIIAAVIVVVGLILLPRAYQPSARSAAQVHYNVPGANISKVVTRPQTLSNQATISNATLITARSRQRQELAMNLTPAKDIRLEQIIGFASGVPAVILFRDGSKLPVDPVTLEQLPADVRFQLTYTREPQ